MGEVVTLVKRNMYRYYRNKGAVIFSLLSAFIVAFLYLFFLADVQIAYVKDAVGDIAGIDNMINTWIVGGLVLIPAVSVPLVLLCFKVDDVVDGTYNDLLISPAKRISITLGYVVSACIVSFIMSIVCFTLCEIVIVFDGGELLSLADTLKVLGIISLVIFSFTGLEYFALSFVRTSAGVSIANSLLNILLGFLLGLYVPVGMLSDGVATAIKSFPLLQVSSIIRQIIMKDSINEVLGNCPDYVAEEVRQIYGVDIVIGEHVLNNLQIIAILIIFGIIFYIGSIIIIKLRKAE